MSNTDYVYIREYGRMMGSNLSFIQTEEAVARATNAPADAFARNAETGGWLRYSEMREGPTKWALAAAVTKAGHRYISPVTGEGESNGSTE